MNEEVVSAGEKKVGESEIVREFMVRGFVRPPGEEGIEDYKPINYGECAPEHQGSYSGKS